MNMLQPTITADNIKDKKKQPHCMYCHHATQKNKRGYCKLYCTWQDTCVNICIVKGTKKPVQQR